MIELALDTDIGSDVDDLLALAMILGSPELRLRAVTTVYGDTLLRARMVSRAYSLARRSSPPVAAGARETLSGRAVWWAGHEGALVPDLASAPVDETLSAVALLRESAAVAAVGPLTNVAAALSGAHDISRLVVMGGDFTSGSPEHNIKCDVTAAQAVFASGVPVLVTGFDQTRRVAVTAAEVDQIAASGALGEWVAAEVRQFQSWSGGHPNSPHDPIAVLAAVRPELFTFARGIVRVDADGVTTLEPDESGPHQVAIDLDPVAVEREIIARICRAQA